MWHRNHVLIIYFRTSIWVNVVTPVFESSGDSTQFYESRRQAFPLCTKLFVGVVLLSSFGGNFVLAKAPLGLVSVHCLELRGLHFWEVRNVLIHRVKLGRLCSLFYHYGIPICSKLYRWCLKLCPIMLKLHVPIISGRSKLVCSNNYCTLCRKLNGSRVAVHRPLNCNIMKCSTYSTRLCGCWSLLPSTLTNRAWD